MVLNIGDLAPDFSVSDQEGRIRSLKEFRGKRLVIWFYPMASTPG